VLDHMLGDLPVGHTASPIDSTLASSGRPNHVEGVMKLGPSAHLIHFVRTNFGQHLAETLTQKGPGATSAPGPTAAEAS
jgi:hypothetical protein